MRSRSYRLALTLGLVAVLPLLGPAASMQQAPAKRAIELQDIIDWKTVGLDTISDDGSGLPTASARAKVMPGWWCGRPAPTRK